MSLLNKVFRSGVTVMIMAVMIGTAPVSAGQTQPFEPGLYTSVLTGFEIEVQGPTYEIVDAELQHYTPGEGEVVQIGSDVVASNVEVSFYDDADTPAETINVYFDAMSNAAEVFEVVDSGVSGDYHYGLARIEYDGVDIVYYVQVYEDVSGPVDLFEGFLTIPGSLESDLSAAQSEVTIDGIMFMENVDPAQLSAALDGAASLGEAEAATPTEPEATVQFSQTDTTVGVGPDFSFIGEPEVRGGLEAVRVEGPGTLSLIAIGQSGDTPGAVMDGFERGIVSVYPGAEQVYEEIREDQAWRILWIPKDDGPATYMVVVVNTASVPDAELMHAHEMPANEVARTVTIIQEQITLNGQPLMPEIDADEMQFYVERHVSDETVTATAEVATAEATEEGRSSNPRDAARLPDTEDDEDGNTSETGNLPVSTEEATAEVTAETSGDTDGPGVLTDSSWEGGVHGHVIEWNPTTWFVDVGYPDDLVSDTENQEDTIVLQSPEESADTWLFISIYGETDATPDDYLDYWISDEYLQAAGSNVEVLDARTRGGSVGVILRYSGDAGEEYIVIRQAIELGDGNMLIVTLDAPAADVVAAYEMALPVTIDGSPALSVFSSSQIQRAIGD